jgi:lysozyme family protein
MDNFNKAMEFILKWEGGYVNDPKDPGGETNFGISKKGWPHVDIKNLTKVKAKDIYRDGYWVIFRCNSYPWPFSVAVLDTYVQHLPSVAEKMVKEANNDLRALLEARRVFYLKLIAKKPDLAKYKKGWFNRINDLAKFCEINQSLY